jgi:amino-acid N-acetyltransferase
MLRKARIDDVKTIHRMINLSSGKGEMLSRSLVDIYHSLRDFFVYYDEDESQVTGICAMTIIWENLAEIALFMLKKAIGEKGWAGNWWKPAFPKPLRWGFSRCLR